VKIVLINPPNCGRSIPEEEFGITSLKMIFRGEPLALETLAGNLVDHEVVIVDLKAAPGTLESVLLQERPDIVGITGVTCEANEMLRLARRIKRDMSPAPVIVAGGHHASVSPEFFYAAAIDYVVVGLGKLAFAELIAELAEGRDGPTIPGVIRLVGGVPALWSARKYSNADLVDDRPPRYDLVAEHRDKYVMSGVGGKTGYVATAFGCTHRCGFCSIPSMTGGRYLTHSPEAVLRDICLFDGLGLIRFVDANTFGDRKSSHDLARRIIDLDLGKKFVADVRADTVVGDPELLALWKKAGLASVVIGFEEIDDCRLSAMNKRSSLAQNMEALRILDDMGIKVIGDFIINPDYEIADFARLARFIEEAPIALPIPSILTPIPGTPLHREKADQIVVHDLDYYTFSNAVLPTRLSRMEFYTQYAALMKHLHQHISTN